MDVKHGGVDVRVTHQMLQGGQGNAGPHHICSERVAKTVRVGGGNPAAPAMVTECATTRGMTRAPRPAINAPSKGSKTIARYICSISFYRES